MNQALLSLPPSDLRALAAGIRTGRLVAPYAASSIGRFLGSPVAAEVSDALVSLAATGMSPIALASTLELLCAALEGTPRIDDVVDLVMTAPDSARVSNRDTGVVVTELFRKAQLSVLVAGYAVYQGRRVFQALAERMKERPGLDVRMFLDIQRKSGDTSAADEIVRRFVYRFRTEEWPSGVPIPQIHFDPRALSLDRHQRAALHAKCVVVDRSEVFVSSANFTEAAQERNVEVGLLLRSPRIASSLSEFFDGLVHAENFHRAN